MSYGEWKRQITDSKQKANLPSLSIYEGYRDKQSHNNSIIAAAALPFSYSKRTVWIRIGEYSGSYGKACVTQSLVSASLHHPGERRTHKRGNVPDSYHSKQQVFCSRLHIVIPMCGSSDDVRNPMGTYVRCTKQNKRSIYDLCDCRGTGLGTGMYIQSQGARKRKQTKHKFLWCAAVWTRGVCSSSVNPFSGLGKSGICVSFLFLIDSHFLRVVTGGMLLIPSKSRPMCLGSSQ